MIIEEIKEIRDIVKKAEAEIRAITNMEVSLSINALNGTLNQEILKQIICTHYNTTWEKILLRWRPREFSDAMFVFMYIARVELNITLIDIGKYCGGRDHTTVINALKQIQKYQDTHDHVCYDINAIKEQFLKKMIK